VLLPILLIAGVYWYITGGQVMSTDDAYAETDKVGVSTDVSGIVNDVDVTENQHVEAGQVLYRLDDAPCRLALGRATAQVGSVTDALNALKANYRDVQAQIQQAQQQLKSAGLYRGAIDGVMGPETQTALSQFQREEGLPQTAQLDQQTMSRLMSGPNVGARQTTPNR
jgi:multidrug resistance efflux pump